MNRSGRRVALQLAQGRQVMDSFCKLKTMRWSIRCLWIWLLALALPMQGVAASAMLYCGAGGEAQPPAHEQMAVHESCAEHGAANFQHGPSPDGVEAGMGMPDDHAACSVCLDCCSVLAIATTRAQVSEPHGGQNMRPLRVMSVASRVIEAPDRPPRPLLP